MIDELEEAKNLADEASRAKTTFLATMSHEIRTPMNAVIGILELALKRAETGRVDRSSIEIAYASAKSLLELIGDILDIARIESGRLSLSPKRANLRELVESVARVFEGLARQKRLSLVLEIDSSINGDVLLDAMRFKQILSNLVSNAIKFTDEGSIRIRIDGRQVEPSLLQVNLCVEDTGIGISLGDQQQLFRPFAQVNRNLQNTEGTGLGLVISRSLCEMMGGRLVMSSELGQGTRIDIELRLQVLEPIVENVRAIPLGSRQARRLQVLVVDDHAVNRQILHQQLSFLGHDVEEAENGLSAQPVAWATVRHGHHRLPHAADERLDLARSIRQEERENGEEPVVIIGLTADAQPEEIERCIQAGMNECLIKPIGLDVLEERLLALGFAADELPVTIDAEPVAIPTAPVSTTWIPACADRRRADDAQAAARRTADQQPQGPGDPRGTGATPGDRRTGRAGASDQGRGEGGAWRATGGKLPAPRGCLPQPERLVRLGGRVRRWGETGDPRPGRKPGGRVHGLTWPAPVARAVNQSSSLCPRIGHVQARKRLHSGWGAFSAEPDQRSEYRPRGHPSRFLRSDSPSGVR